MAEGVGTTCNDVATSQVAEEVLVLLANVGPGVAQLARHLVLRVGFHNLFGESLYFLRSFRLGFDVVISQYLEAYLLNAFINIDCREEFAQVYLDLRFCKNG